MRTIYRIFLAMAAVVLAFGCTTNNGPHHPIYGMWKVTEIEIDGTPMENYNGNLFFQFQNDVVHMAGLSYTYGMWKEHDDYKVIDMWFELKDQVPAPETHFISDGVNTCKVITLTSSRFVFDMTNSASESVYRYTMEKWN